MDRRHRFGIGLAGSVPRAWHAVDLASHGPALAAAEAAGGPWGVLAVCGVITRHLRSFGDFTTALHGVEVQNRCARCGWVVALTQGTVDQEIAFYTGGDENSVLHQVFTAILADLPPGATGRPGLRSDLLAHASLHRPVILGCEPCSLRQLPAEEVHGPSVRVCPEARLVCESCTFVRDSWAPGCRDHHGYRRDWTSHHQDGGGGECVVAAPCSALLALAEHYEIPVDEPEPR